MKTTFIIWNAHLKSAFYSLRHDNRAKIAWYCALIFDCGVGVWFINQLLAHLTQWEAAGSSVLETNIWLLFLGAWIGIGLFTSLSTITLGFVGDQPIFLMTLPVPPAARFRALYALQFFEGIGNWLLLASVVMGIPLVIVLGWQALPWLLLLLLGVTITVWMSILVTLITLRYVLPHLKRSLLIGALICVGIGCIYLAVHIAATAIPLPTPSMPPPMLASFFCFVVLVLVSGPFAGVTGRLYENAFHEMESRTRSRAVINIPGVRPLTTWLKRHRNLASALLVKGILNQSRNVFTWGRVALIAVYIGLFPLIHTLLFPFGFSGVSLSVVYTSGVAILSLVEYVPYALSGEGNRLMYYLVAPTGVNAYLRSRLILHVVPALMIGLITNLVMSFWIGLSALELIQAAGIMSLIVTCYISFCVLGSAWDEDLNLVSEGVMQVISLEELPFTPRRLQLLGLSFLLLGAMFLMIWKLPVFLSLPLLLLLLVIVLLVGWHFSNAQIQGLLKRG